MTISDFIYDHFAGLKGGLKKGSYSPLTMVSLKNTALKALRVQSQEKKRFFGQDALLPFTSVSTKTSVKEDGTFDVAFENRPLGKIKKDLWQILTSGMFSENLMTEKKQKIDHYKNEKNAGFKIYSAFVNEKDYWKTKIDTNKTYEQYVDLLISNGEAKSKGGRLEIVVDDIEKGKNFIVSGPSIILATNIYQLHKLARKENINENIIEPVVYLASLLMLPAMVSKEDIRSDKDFSLELSRKLLPYLYESIDKKIEDSFGDVVANFAVKIANDRIEKLNQDIEEYNKDKDDKEKLEKYLKIDNFYYDARLEELLDQRITKFQDLPIRWAREGSNYKWTIVNKDGTVENLFVTDDEKLEEESCDYAFKSLESKDEAQILAAFEFFDNQITNEKNHDKIVDTFEEVAEILFSNLILLSYVNKKGQIDQGNRENMEQIFTLPLVQCLGNMDRKGIIKAEQKSYESVKRLFKEAGKEKEFEDNFKYFNHRYNRERISTDYIKKTSKIVLSELRKAQNKKSTKKGNEKIVESALQKLLSEFSLSYPKGMLTGLYKGILPSDFNSDNSERKSDYQNLYDAVFNGNEILTSDSSLEIYFKVLCHVGKNLDAIKKLGDNNPDTVIDENAVRSISKDKKEIKNEIKDIINDVLKR